ncbi:MAG: guanosine-3',5'-bis(diphosphate) 3'-diphosphatase [endosymbiont of Galathealinum brachiosum]|uniref:guanosine-3',5'-bis(diphosphate) 3'-diphosphatase n=1 Tax=endosymbiont of Galathealinum brachiosum TaxID=2200906 RepID=A0A370DCD9_9GAMM|nr:MAG: guanosine-3',5'-bis(diphosphate) 3'-diphosphatase [endosymbiont of Galathealinum brachiosum]
MAISPDQTEIDVKDLYGDPSRFLISDLCRIVEDYMNTDQVRDVYQAYLFGAQAHEGQFRQTGEPYIYHPISVARILAEMHMDSKSICAAILHDVIEDTPATKDEVADKFGDDVAELVDGVSKLTEFKFKNKKEQQAINIQKVLMAMARDIRVILIKLADRLHNMRTLGVMRPEKRRRIAQETLDIYVPLARRLGINTLRLELEDLGFRAMHPMRYKVLEHAMLQEAGNRKEIIHKIHNGLTLRLDELSIEAEVNSRRKHPFSLYKKMREKNLSYRNIFDVYGMRVVVDTVDDCYRVLGAVHNLFKPIPGKFKDYIAIPKENGYQSLHTVLFGPHAIPIEIQIRTSEMDNFAETGIAAHWLYKEDSGNEIDVGGRTREWLTGILEMQQAAGDSVEFLENVKVDLFPDELYVYTPNGDIVKLPKNSTPIDFAYSVHTDVGHTCVASKVDHRFAPLDTPLYSGQTIEVITSDGAHPNPGWLDFVVTAKARSNILNYLKNIRSEDAVAQGRRLLSRMLLEKNITLEEMTADSYQFLLDEYGFSSLNQLLEDIGMGNRPAGLVARRLFTEEVDETNQKQDEASGRSPLAIQGTEGMVVSYAKCCRPIPGDQIVGKLSKGRGLVIHQVSCKNIVNERLQSENMIDVTWAIDPSGEYSCQLNLHVQNERGVLARLATIISDESANIEHVEVEDKDGISTNISFLISVNNRNHLAKILRRLRRVSSVMRIVRVQ